VQFLIALAVAGVTSSGDGAATLDNYPELKLALSQSQRQIRSVDGSFSIDPLNPSTTAARSAPSALRRTESVINATVSFPTIEATAGTALNGVVTLARPSDYKIEVTLRSNNLVLKVPTIVSIPAGATKATFVASCSPVQSDTKVTVTAAGSGITDTVSMVNVRSPRVQSVTFSSSAITHGQSATGTVKLESPAPEGGMQVQLVNVDSAALECPASVVVPAGQVTATFTVIGRSVETVTNVKIEAKPSYFEKTSEILLSPKFDVILPNLVHGQNETAKIVLGAPATAGGSTVKLFVNTKKLRVPSSVLVSEGLTTATFDVRCNGPVKDAVLTVTYNGAVKTYLVSVQPQ